MKRYSDFIGESIRDKMTPVSKDTILDRFKDSKPEKMFELSFKHNMVELLKVALDRGINPNYETDRGTSYLSLACANGMYEFVEVLLQHGADVNIRGRRERTPLIEAVSESRKDVVELLLKNNADVNLKDDVGETALMYSVDMDITKLLLEYGADINTEDKYGRTVLDYARELNRYDIFNYLRKYPVTNESLMGFFKKKDFFTYDRNNEEFIGIDEDYGIKDIKDVDPDIVQYTQESLEKFMSKVKIWDTVKVVFVKDMEDDTLARFRSETSSSTPIIMLSDDNMLSGAEEYDVEPWVAVETTIFHELGHAICELERDMFGYMYLEYGDEEEWVEDFAYDLHENGWIPADLKLFIKKI